MDRATVVKLYQASLTTKKQTNGRPPLKRPKRVDLENKKETKESGKENKDQGNFTTVFKSPPTGRWCTHVKATIMPPMFPRRPPISNEEALIHIKKHPGYGMDTQEWDKVAERLVAEPETNYAFWDACEPNELAAYAIHFVKQNFAVGHNKNFHANWTNVSKAYHFSIQLCGQYEFEDDEEQEYTPKAAIAASRAFKNGGTFILDEGMKANHEVLALRDDIKAFFDEHKTSFKSIKKDENEQKNCFNITRANKLSR